MKDFIGIDQIWNNFYRKKLRSFIDKISFLHILLLWIFIVVSFGFIYYYMQNKSSYLYYVIQQKSIVNLVDSIYFSFVGATTTGFGDIIPFGWFKVVAIIEVIFGLMLLAIVTSKLVSIKQDAILVELYELSFTERVNRLRSSLLLFRQNLDRIMSRIEEGDVRRRDIATVYIYFSSFEDTLRECIALIDISDHKEFVKKIDPVNMELVYNSIINSFEKINEFVSVVDEHKVEWKSDLNAKLVNECIVLADKLFINLNISENLSKETKKELNSRYIVEVSKIKDSLSNKKEDVKQNLYKFDWKK